MRSQILRPGSGRASSKIRCDSNRGSEGVADRVVRSHSANRRRSKARVRAGGGDEHPNVRSGPERMEFGWRDPRRHAAARRPAEAERLDRVLDLCGGEVRYCRAAVAMTTNRSAARRRTDQGLVLDTGSLQRRHRARAGTSRIVLSASDIDARVIHLRQTVADIDHRRPGASAGD